MIRHTLKKAFEVWDKKRQDYNAENRKQYHALFSRIHEEENERQYSRILFHHCRRSHRPIFKLCFYFTF